MGETEIDDAPPASGMLAELVSDRPLDMATALVIDEDLIETVVRAAAPNTLRALRADLRVFQSWCHKQQLPVLPASARTIVQFLRDQAAAGKAVATLNRYLASLSRLHKLLDLADPTRDQRVRLELKAQRVELGVRQRQALGLRFKGEVGDPLSSVEAGGVCVAHLLEACPTSLDGLRDRALLSVAYDTGLRRAELVRVRREHIERLASGAGRLLVPTSKTDREGRGSYAFLSLRSMRALRTWLAAARIEAGPVFRRLHHTRTKQLEDVWTPGRNPLSPQSVSLIYKVMARRAYEAGLLDELDGAEFERWLAGISAHSTRVGLTQDLFAAGQDLAGIMQALRWKSPAQPARYAQALAVEANAAAKVVGKL